MSDKDRVMTSASASEGACGPGTDVGALLEPLYSSGACTCTWDAADADGVDHGRDVICRPDPECPLHVLLSALGVKPAGTGPEALSKKERQASLDRVVEERDLAIEGLRLIGNASMGWAAKTAHAYLKRVAALQSGEGERHEG